MFLKRMNSAAPLQSCPGGDASGCDGTTGLQSGSTNSSSSQWNLQALNMADALSRFNLFRPHMLSKCFFKQTNCSPWGEERSEIHVWLYEAVYYLFKPSGSHAHVSESEQLTLNLSVKEPLRRQDAPADCTLNARHSLVPSSCVAGGSLSILNSSLDSSSEPSFPTNAQISVRLDKETMLTFLYWCKQFKKAAFLTAVPSPSFTSWMMSSGREKLFSLFGNGRISDSCCVTEKWQSQWWWPRSARHVTNTQHVCVCVLTSACMSYIVPRWSQMTEEETCRPMFWLNLSLMQIMWKWRFTPADRDTQHALHHGHCFFPGNTSTHQRVGSFAFL